MTTNLFGHGREGGGAAKKKENIERKVAGYREREKDCSSLSPQRIDRELFSRRFRSIPFFLSLPLLVSPRIAYLQLSLLSADFHPLFFFRDYVTQYGLNGGSSEDSSRPDYRFAFVPSVPIVTSYPPCGCCTPRSSIMASRYYSSREYARGRGILIDGFRVESESQVRV